jgi:hypothetical protein
MRIIGLFNCVVSRDEEALRLLLGCSVVVVVVELVSRHRQFSRAIRPSFHRLWFGESSRVLCFNLFTSFSLLAFLFSSTLVQFRHRSVFSAFFCRVVDLSDHSYALQSHFFPFFLGEIFILGASVADRKSGGDYCGTLLFCFLCLTLFFRVWNMLSWRVWASSFSALCCSLC